MKESSKRKYLSMWLDKFRHVHDDKLKCLNELSSFFADHPNLSEFGDKATEPNARKNSYSSQQKLFWIIYSFFIYSIILWNSFFELLRFKKVSCSNDLQTFSRNDYQIKWKYLPYYLILLLLEILFLHNNLCTIFSVVSTQFFLLRMILQKKILPWRKIGKA